MAFTLSPNMSLIIPGVGSEAGPTYAQDVNNSLTIVDGHNHSPGSGVQITPNGLNINSQLTFQNNPAINVGYLNMTLLSTAPTAAQSLYVKNGSEVPVALPDLWYFDGTNNIQITSGGNVNAALTSLPGQSYNPGPPGTFVWKQGALSSTPADFDIGSITLRPLISGTTFGVTLQAASTGTYALTFPAALPAAQSFVTIDNTGAIATPITFANGITRNNLAAVGQQISSSSASFSTGSNSPTPVTNLSVTLTTTGRPVMLMLNSDGTNGGGVLETVGTMTLGAPFALEGEFQFKRGSTVVSVYRMLTSFAGNQPTAQQYNSVIPSSSMMFLDTPIAGTYTYTVTAAVPQGTSVSVLNTVLTAYEL